MIWFRDLQIDRCVVGFTQIRLGFPPGDYSVNNTMVVGYNAFIFGEDIYFDFGKLNLN